MPCAKTVDHGLESLSYIGSELWDSIPSHMKEMTLLMNLNMSLKLENLICAHADFAKFIYKTLDICSQRLSPFALPYTFPFLVSLFVGIYGIYLKFDLGPFALISILFIYIAIVM